jgi:hypothetical protein
MVTPYYHPNMESQRKPAGLPELIFEVWQGRLGIVTSSQYGTATAPVLVTCGPSRPYFRGRASGDGHFLLPSQYGIATKPVFVTWAFQTKFSMFGKRVWGWSFLITIPIWNSDDTHFGDLRHS